MAVIEKAMGDSMAEDPAMLFLVSFAGLAGLSELRWSAAARRRTSDQRWRHNCV